MKFTKWQGCGNDFILLDCMSGGEISGEAAKRLCDRHYGIGADGVLLMLKSEVADFRMRVLNADGSEAEMCGNGIRCFARHAALYKGAGESFLVETGAGVLTPRLNGEMVTVDMGEPHLAGDDIPVKGFGRSRVIEEPVDVDGETYKMTCVSMGNPHAVIFVDNAETFPVERVGAIMEKHELFPRKTNVEFVTVTDARHLRMRVWERGAAVTLACGTGSCASLVAAYLTGRTGRQALVTLDGGSLTMDWREDNHIYMTGEAKQVFTGEVSL